MKRITKILSSISVSLFLSLSGLIGFGVAHAAGSATMSLTPASGSYADGATLSLDVYEDSGSTGVYLARAAITYPAASLAFVSFTPGPAWSNSPVHSGGSGTAELDVASAGGSPLSGNQLMGTIVFTASQGGGTTANVTLNQPDPGNPNDYSASSVQTYDLALQKDEELLTSVSSGSYTLTGGTSGGSSSSGSSSGSSSSSSSSKSTSSTSKSTPSTTKSTASTTTPASTTAPAITVSNVAVSNITSDSATVSWTTSVATSSEVDYGLNTKYGFTVVQADQVTSHSVALRSSDLSSGTLYHFVVRGTGASQAVVSQDTTFRTKGVTVVVSVVDQNNKAVKGAAVSAVGASGTTDGSGNVTLNDLPTGQIKVTVVYNGTTTNSTIYVGSQASQARTVKIKVAATKSSLILPIVIIAGLVVIVLMGRAIMLKRRENAAESSRHFPKLPGSGPSAPSGSGGPGGVITPGGSSSPGSSSSNLSANPGNTIKPNSGLS